MYSALSSELREDIFHLARGLKPLVAVLGPTASGKTTFALDLAEDITRHTGLPVTIINADSRQLYRGLTIGTAKIRPEEMRGIPHALLDVLDPNEELTAASYQRMAFPVIDEAHAAGVVPLLVGGSMLYLSAITDELSFTDSADPALRAQLEEEYERDRGASLYAKLLEMDSDTALAFHPNNKPYLIRAMEILLSTGEKPSTLKTREQSRYALLQLGIRRTPEDLAGRIRARTAEMFSAGWTEEVRSLLHVGYGPDNPAMKSHGYREIMRYLREGLPATEEELQEIIAAKARQYAKRQMTWWKRDTRIRWIP